MQNNTNGPRHDAAKGSVRSRLRIACAVVLALCVLGLAAYWLQQRRAQAEYEKLQQQNQPSSSAAASSDAASASQPAATPQPLVPVNFDELQSRNPDAYAWITIPGTLVDYPVLQNAENTDYYLDHTFEKAYGLPGAIYTRNDTAQDFSDPCTVVYGHNMKNDTMFGSLHEYENAAFFADASNRTIHTYNPDCARQWTIFAAVEYSDVLLSAAYDFADPAQLQAFVDSLRSCRGSFDSSVPVDGTSRLIVLSTCIGGKDTSRYLVVGVLTDEMYRTVA